MLEGVHPELLEDRASKVSVGIGDVHGVPHEEFCNGAQVPCFKQPSVPLEDELAELWVCRHDYGLTQDTRPEYLPVSVGSNFRQVRG